MLRVYISVQELSSQLCSPGSLPLFLSRDQPFPVPEALPVDGRWRICSLAGHSTLPPGTSLHIYCVLSLIWGVCVCVCVQLMYGGSRGQLSSPSFLNPLLQSALDSSLHGDSPYTQLLSFAISRPHTAVQPYGMALSLSPPFHRTSPSLQ